MSNTQATLKGTDWWLMSADGSQKARLSFFNEPGSDINAGKLVTVGPIAVENWEPDGTAFYADVQTNIATADGMIIRAELSCAP